MFDCAVSGLALFQQFWYWYPMVHFLSLSFTPTAVIGLNKDLRIPEEFKLTSAAPPSKYAYPPPIETKKKEEKKRIQVAQLSVTAKVKAKAKRKQGTRLLLVLSSECIGCLVL